MHILTLATLYKLSLGLQKSPTANVGQLKKQDFPLRRSKGTPDELSNSTNLITKQIALLTTQIPLLTTQIPCLPCDLLVTPMIDISQNND